MGDNHMKTLQANPKQELEELYQGIPDESVNLTFQDLANVNSSHNINNTTKVPSPSLSTVPSLDFRKGLEAVSHTHKNHHHDGNIYNHHHYHYRQHQDFSHVSGGSQSRIGEYSMCYDGMKSGESFASGKGGSGGGSRRRRPGIPHSNICTICSNYAYIFRTRCLVCGRVYCRQCVEIGMGEMTEGRKCIECLGLRFSQRYIERAGMVGCCSWRYPTTLKHAEIKWAEKGPRRSGDRGHGHHHSMVSSRSRTPRTPPSFVSNEPSFVMSATHSPFSAHHHLPL